METQDTSCSDSSHKMVFSVHHAALQEPSALLPPSDPGCPNVNQPVGKARISEKQAPGEVIPHFYWTSRPSAFVLICVMFLSFDFVCCWRSHGDCYFEWQKASGMLLSLACTRRLRAPPVPCLTTHLNMGIRSPWRSDSFCSARPAFQSPLLLGARLRSPFPQV